MEGGPCGELGTGRGALKGVFSGFNGMSWGRRGGELGKLCYGGVGWIEIEGQFNKLPYGGGGI